jgi:hypothetical protein
MTWVCKTVIVVLWLTFTALHLELVLVNLFIFYHLFLRYIFKRYNCMDYNEDYGDLELMVLNKVVCCHFLIGTLIPILVLAGFGISFYGSTI